MGRRRGNDGNGWSMPVYPHNNSQEGQDKKYYPHGTFPDAKPIPELDAPIKPGNGRKGIIRDDKKLEAALAQTKLGPKKAAAYVRRSARIAAKRGTK